MEQSKADEEGSRRIQRSNVMYDLIVALLGFSKVFRRVVLSVCGLKSVQVTLLTQELPR